MLRFVHPHLAGLLLLEGRLQLPQQLRLSHRILCRGICCSLLLILQLLLRCFQCCLDLPPLLCFLFGLLLQTAWQITRLCQSTMFSNKAPLSLE